jgi:hypothetical protein
MRSVSLINLIIDFFKIERLHAKCYTCECVLFSRKAIFELQDMIFIQLKRYFVNQSGDLIKNQIEIDIDFVIDSVIFGSKNVKSEYVLSAIVCYEGETLYGGHYIAYCKEEDENWRKYNDMPIESVFVDIFDKFTHDYKYCTLNSYVLFYVVRDGSSNLKRLKPDLELQFSDMKIQDNIQIDFKKEEENKEVEESEEEERDLKERLPNLKQLEFESENEVNMQQENKQNDTDNCNNVEFLYETTDNENNDEEDDNDYFGNIIKNEKIVFIFNENEKHNIID